MIVHVEYTAQLRVRTGIAAEAIELGDGARIDDLIAALAGRYDIREFLPGNLLCFVDDSQADRAQVLADGDAITLLTPISGG